MSEKSITLADVEKAAAAIKGAVERTPLRVSQTLSQISGAQIFLKFENLQFTAAYKERGALNKLLSLTPDERKKGVVAMSAGNHAQGVAYHAGRLGIKTTIVMPEGTPFNKIKHTENFGARVIVEGETLAAATALAEKLSREDGMIFVHPFDDPLVVAGQGTVALEMLEDIPDLDVLVIPVGGGGLISGMSVVAKAKKPNIEIYGVEAEAFPCFYNVLKQKDLPFARTTLAEGIAVRHPGKIGEKIIAEKVNDLLLVSETQIEHAIADLLEIEKTIVEGAGAAAYAAVLAHPSRFKGKKVGLVLSGGNIDMRLLSNLMLRVMSRQGRILSVSIEMDDRPGMLAKVAQIVGDAGGNILEVSHHRHMIDTPIKSATLALTIEARDEEHGVRIKKGLEDAGFRLI